jgi:hypothetical protein
MNCEASVSKSGLAAAHGANCRLAGGKNTKKHGALLLARRAASMKNPVRLSV